MATEIQKYTSDEKFANYVTLVVALKFTKDGLKDYVESKIRKFYVRLSNNCAGYLSCDLNCSKTHGDSINRWCKTCKKWRSELCKYMRYPGRINKMKWESFDSSSWGRDSRLSTMNQIVNIFVHNCRDTKESSMDDIVNIISLFENCTYFRIGNNKQLMKDVRKMRNEYFAHNKSFMLGEKELNMCLQTFSDCLQQRYLQQNNMCFEAYKILRELRNVRYTLQNKYVRDLHKTLIKVPLEGVQRQINKYLNDQQVRHTPTRATSWYCSAYCSGPVLAGVIGIIVFFFNIRTADIEDILQINKDTTSCLSMDFSFPWRSDLNFEYYIKMHGELIGRQWLIEDLNYFTLKTEYRGVLLATEMGFGKSAIVSNIACAVDKLWAGNPIYSNLASIHICRFDSHITLKPGIFVRNMAAGIAQKFPEYGNIIHLDRMAHDYLFTEKCFEDPQGCFDFGILSPLQKTQGIPDKLIVLVDALDECIEYGRENIFTLLYEKIPRLPSFVKILLTSRNISQITEKLPPGIIVYNNPSFREKSGEDINRYIQFRLQNDTVNKQFSQILSSFSRGEKINKLIEMVHGNFLYLIHAFDFWLNSGNIYKIPDTLEHIYELNLERVFGKSNENFENLRSIFEILCASLTRVKWTQLYSFLNIINPHEKIVISRLLSGDMSHFVTNEMGTIGFAHKHFADYLSSIDKARKKFYISKRNGHVRISKYWIKYWNKSMGNLANILDSFYHVANCEDKSLEKQFSNVINFMKTKNESYKSFHHILHKAVARINSYNTINFMLKVMQLHIDELDLGKLTPSFIAAAYGNDDSLKALLVNGAFKDFARPSYQVHQISSEVDLIYICKYETHWGYSLLNIASQNGHENVVRLLVESQINLLHENTIGLNSFHLAAEHGHNRILRFLNSVNPSLWIHSLNHSLYLSAKNGHVHVVEYLLSLGAIDHCLPCDGSLYWVPRGKKRLQSKGLHDLNDIKDYILKDDEQLLFCESALEVATQGDHIDVMKILVNKKTNALSCSDARGQTPILTAAAYDREDILLYMLQKSKQSFCTKCSEKPVFKHFTSDLEKNKMLAKYCSPDLSLPHILALYSTSDTIFSLIENNFRDWRVRDSNDASPLHYASCSGVDIAKFVLFKFVQLFFRDETKNGSTPLHSAAICHNFLFLSVISLRKIESDFMLKAKDFKNRNILHYLAIENIPQSIYQKGVGKIMITRGLIDHITRSSAVYNKLMREQDAEGRTPLHYAAMSGNHSILHSIAYELDLEVYQIRDNNGLSILDTLLEYMIPITPIQNRHYVLFIPTECNLLSVYNSEECSSERLLMLDSFEYFAYEIFSKLVNTSLVSRKDIFKYMQTGIMKNRIHTLGLLKAFYPELYKSVLTEEAAHFYVLFMKGYIYPSPFVPSLLLNDIIASYCLTNTTILNLSNFFIDRKRTFWTLYTNIEYKNLFVFDHNITDIIRLCPLYKIFPFIVIGGNMVPYHFLPLAKYGSYNLPFFVKTAPCLTFKVSQFYTSVIYTLFLDGIRIMEPTSQPYSHSFMMYFVVQKFFVNTCKDQKDLFFCYRSSKLSFIHLLYAKGFANYTNVILETLNKTAQKNRILNCKNNLLISPRELSIFFYHSPSIQTNDDSVIFLNQNFVALLFKVLMDSKAFVFPKSSVAWRCINMLFANKRRHFRKTYCLKKLEREILSLLAVIRKSEKHVFLSIFNFTDVIEFIRPLQWFEKDIIAHIEYLKNTRYLHQLFPYNKIHKETFSKMNYTGCNWGSSKQFFAQDVSKMCVRYLSALNKMKLQINHKIRACLQMIFPLLYLLYDEKIAELPPIAGRNAEDNAKVMLAYAAVPNFHNSPKFNFWDDLQSDFNNPFREMVQAILSSNISDIVDWANVSNTPNKFGFGNPLAIYDAVLPKSDDD